MRVVFVVSESPPPGRLAVALEGRLRGGSLGDSLLVYYCAEADGSGFPRLGLLQYWGDVQLHSFV